MSLDDIRNNKSWRLENKVKLSPHHPPQRDEPMESKNKDKRLKLGKQNSEHSQNTTVNSETLKLKSPSATKDSRYIDIERATAALWRHNLIGYIDNFGRDLYKHCEELDDDGICREVARYFQERVTEFSDLANRVESQRRLEEGKSNSAAWSVSKRDMTSASQTISTTPPSKTTHTLRASAHVFTPSVTTKKLFNAETSSVGSGENQNLAAHLAMVAVNNTNSFNVHSSLQQPQRERASTESNLSTRKQQQSAAGKFPSMGEETYTQSKKSSVFPPPSQLDSDGSSSLFASERNTTNQNNSKSTSERIQKPLNITANQTSTHNKSDSFDLTEREVARARERVWETAEALADAALDAEEQQWVSLGLSQKQTFRKTFQQGSKNHRLTLDTGTLDASPRAGFREEEHGLFTPNQQQSSYPAPLTSPTSSVNGSHSAGGFHSTRKSSFSHNGSPFYTPNGSFHSSYVSPAPNSAGKALHDKLSSPDRKRSHNTDEQRRRYDERHSIAEQNRKQETEKVVNKARVATVRNQDRLLREQEKLSHKEQEIQRKQSQAEQRKAEQLDIVKKRAENENTKVEEVIFINTLNSECVADELNKKLIEAEARVLAAEGRRQQRLEDISSQQKTRNTRKVQQISELHMAQERDKMERFEKLQQKLRDVEERKKERLVEMKRRDEVVEEEMVETMITLVPTVSAVSNVVAKNHTNNTTTKLTKKDKKHKNKFTQPHSSSSLLPAVPAALTPATDIAVGPSPSTATTETNSRNAKAKAKKARRRAANQLATQALTVEQFNQLIATSSSNTALSESEEEVDSQFADVTASLQCISDSYQLVQSGVQKKIVLAARTAFVECASVVPSVVLAPALVGSTSATVKQDDAHLTRMLSAYTADISTSISPRPTESTTSFTAVAQPSSGKYSTIALQLLAADTPISVTTSAASAAEQDRLNGGGVHMHNPPTQSPGHSPHHVSEPISPPHDASIGRQERQVKLNISLVLCTVDATDPASVSQFVSEGGVLLLRVLLGYEIGILSSAVTFNETLNCSADPALGKSLGLIIFELIASCVLNDTGRRELFSYGVPVLLADVVSVLFGVQESLCRDTAHFQKYSDTLSEYSNSSSNATQGVRFPYCVSVLLPCVVKTVSIIVNVIDSQESPPQAQSQTISDSYLWYLFCSGVFTSLASSIRSDVQCLQFRHAQDSSLSSSSSSGASAGVTSSSSVDYKQYHTVEARESIVCSAQLVASIGAYLRASGGVYSPHVTSTTATTTTNIPDITRVVRSIVQLSPQTHAHPKGRQMVSLLRRSEVAGSLVSLLYSLIKEFEHINTQSALLLRSGVIGNIGVKTTRRGNTISADSYLSSTPSASQLRVFSSLIHALFSIATADISLIQQLNQEQQVQFVNGVNYLLKSYVASLDDGNTVNIFTTPSPGTSSNETHTSSFSTHFTKSHAEDSIRQLLMLTALGCLRNVSLQKECGLASNITPLFAPETATLRSGVDLTAENKNNNNRQPTSLLVTLCRMSNKFYKDKKFKHCLLPCLLTMSLDVDSNINALRGEGKLHTIIKYLEYYIHDLEKYQTTAGQAIINGDGSTSVEKTENKVEKDEKVHSVDPVEILVRISRLFPTDIWSTAVLTYTSR